MVKLRHHVAVSYSRWVGQLFLKFKVLKVDTRTSMSIEGGLLFKFLMNIKRFHGKIFVVEYKTLSDASVNRSGDTDMVKL